MPNPQQKAKRQKKAEEKDARKKEAEKNGVPKVHTKTPLSTPLLNVAMISDTTRTS